MVGLLVESGVHVEDEINKNLKESNEILSIVAKSRKTMKEKINKLGMISIGELKILK